MLVFVLGAGTLYLRSGQTQAPGPSCQKEQAYSPW